jgi:predicted kinase
MDNTIGTTPKPCIIRGIPRDVTIPKLLILRGIPGAGKTTLYEHKFASWMRVSIDDFFTNDIGEYRFIRSMIGRAREWCYQLASLGIAAGRSVVVDNCNRELRDFSRYLEIPNAEIKVYRVCGHYHSNKEVPEHVMKKYLHKFKPYDEERLVQLNFLEDGKSKLLIHK